jgi:hypothetical protein
MAGLGPALATKLAEQIGIPAPHAVRVGDAIRELSNTVAPSQNADIEFEFHKLATVLRITARHQDRVAESRVALNA